MREGWERDKFYFSSSDTILAAVISQKPEIEKQRKDRDLVRWRGEIWQDGRKEGMKKGNRREKVIGVNRRQEDRKAKESVREGKELIRKKEEGKERENERDN